MQTNYHTHTYRCHHAFGKDEDYVRQAIRQGFKKLGFSDHTCWNYPYTPGQRVRMSVSDFDGYAKSVRALQKKYAGDIDLLLGVEAEYFEDYIDWLIDFAIEKDLDYLIFGNHYLGKDDRSSPWTGSISEKQLTSYIDTCIKGLKSGIYSYLAHPDLPLFSGRFVWNENVEKEFERLCLAAKELDIPLEYNCTGLMRNLSMDHEGYPHHKFWELAARTGNKAIIGMDSHMPDDMTKKLYDLGRSNLEKTGIEIVDELPLVDFRKIREKRRAAKPGSH